MSKQTPTVEWIVAESEAEWERLCPVPVLNLASERHRRLHLRRAFWCVTALLLLLASANSVSAPAPISPVAEKSSKPSAPDHWFLPGAVVSVPGLGIENIFPAYTFEAIQNFTVQDEQATVRVIMYTEYGKPAYRQTRFYQRTGPDWRQMMPDDALWGPARTLETPNFVYHFRQNDEQTVVVVAAQVDALYATMQRNLGLPISLGGEKLVIEVNLTSRPSTAPSRPSTDNHFSVASPALYLAPVALTDAQILAQSIALPLLDHLLAQASQHHDLPSSWQPLLNGLRLWQLWNLELPLAIWREDIVQWLYSDLPTAAARQPPPLPDRYADLCAAHQLWLLSPSQVGIPLLCSRLKLEATYFPWYYLNPPTHLAQLNLPLAQHDQLKERRDRGLSVALATLIEYAVVTYGQEQLPVLVAGLGHYESWATLIPAVYGVSATEFEAGWQAYLAVQYGISPFDK